MEVLKFDAMFVEEGQTIPYQEDYNLNLIIYSKRKKNIFREFGDLHFKIIFSCNEYEETLDQYILTGLREGQNDFSFKIKPSDKYCLMRNNLLGRNQIKLTCENNFGIYIEMKYQQYTEYKNEELVWGGIEQRYLITNFDVEKIDDLQRTMYPCYVIKGAEPFTYFRFENRLVKLNKKRILN